MGGIDFFKQLQVLAPRQILKLLFMTGGSYTSETNTFLKTANVNYCEKPIDIKKLFGLIQKIIF